jgi:hypothetical protein
MHNKIMNSLCGSTGVRLKPGFKKHKGPLMNRNVCDCNAVSSQTDERFGRWLGAVLLALAFSLSACLPATAVVVIQDTFDDADRNNDGITDDGNMTPVGTNDGIKWFAIDGMTSGLIQRPGLTIVDDNVEGGIGTGNALRIGGPGGLGVEFMGRFGQTITLGSTVGSQLIFSYDIRNMDLIIPAVMNWRFGVYQDSDNQFGMASTNTDGSPTVWGETDGLFDGRPVGSEPVGTFGDYGVLARVHGGTSPSNDSHWRIYEEVNHDTVLGGTGDNDVVANPTLEEYSAMSTLNNNLPHHIKLIITRVEANASGNTVRHDLDVDGTSFGAHDANGVGTVHFDSRDSFDYFVGVWATAAPAFYLIDNFKIESIIAEPPTGLPGDYNDDGVVDAADYTVWRNNLGTNFNLNGNGDETGPSMGVVDAADYLWWKTNYGNTAPGAGGGSLGATAVPEPGTGVLFGICLALAACGWRRRAV